MPNDPEVSVIIPCKAHAQELRQCLRALEPEVAAAAAEIVVVDSVADPAVADAVAAFPQVRLVRSTDGLPPGPARNFGVREARGRWLAFLDADCAPERGWLAAARAGLDGGARLVGGPVLDALPWHAIAVADNLLQFVDASRHRPDGPATIFPACNLAIRRVDFLEAGGFPDTGGLAGEDLLFCKAVAARWPDGLRFVQEMQVRHRGRTTIGALWRHHHQFGLARGRFGLELQPLHQRIGRWAVAGPPIVLKRLSYLALRMAYWDPPGLLRVAAVLPLLLIGLAGWAKGFREGCRLAAEAPCRRS